MISLASELTDRKSRHARGWLFYDAECEFCARTAGWLAGPLHKRGLAVAPLQDPRVAPLLGLTAQELLQAIRLVIADGRQLVGADAFVGLAHELWWARPVVWMSKVPGGSRALRAAYEWIAMNRRCKQRSASPSIPCHTGREGMRP